ncbi:MAG TPA: hypothetical protein VH592_23335 [Gemmataceae bacterium]|jgi:hypothetical protein
MCALILIVLPTPVQAVTTTFGDIEITPEPPPKGTSSHGYFEYVFYLVNKSTDRPHTVSLSIPFEKSSYASDSIRELRRTVQVGANETVRVSLLQPDYPPIGGMDVAVSIDGRQQEREVPLKMNESLPRYHTRYRGRALRASSATAEPLILLGPRVKALPRMEPAPGSMPPGGMPGGPGRPLGMGSSAAVPPLPKKMNVSPPATPGIAMGRGLPPDKTPGVLLLRLPHDEMLSVLHLSPLGRTLRMALGWQKGELEGPQGKPGLPPAGLQFVSAETWSSNWLAYTRYDGIIITAEELNALPTETQTALWQYVETGGPLLVLGQTELPGLSAVTERKNDREWLTVSAGLGVCRISPDANYDAWNAGRFELLMSDWRSTSATWSAKDRSIGAANSEFPIIEDLGVPIKGLFVLMFLFALGIGPVNIFVLSRLKRRIWLLWTTPVLSLCTCVAVFGFMLISEGWHGRLRSETLTLLDETTHRATTLAWTGVYSPLTPGEGLHFSRESEVIPQRFSDEQDRGTHSCTIDWTEDQHFASGWVEARVPVHFKVRKSELRRERVTLQHERDGRWSMVNGLGAAVRRFWYADAKGQIHVAEDIGPGAKAMLKLTEKESHVALRSLRSILVGNTLNWMNTMQSMLKNPPVYLSPGVYLAEIEESPFLEDALRNARTQRLHALVVGFPPNSPER